MSSNESTALVSVETGEVPPRFELHSYLKALDATGQNALAAAYDAACSAVIGPNDVQAADGRSFKKKSAWRKLARYFNISVQIIEEPTISQVGEFMVATVRARATAPWGQSFDDVGSCGTDEATGRRTISIADAVATAATRASNRAVSNLIAMGEVSAEEIGDHKSRQQSSSKGPVLPFGDKKGTPLADLSSEELNTVKQWCVKKDAAKFANLIDNIDTELDSRHDQ